LWMILEHFDWLGTEEELEKFTSAIKKTCAETKGFEYKGRFAPWNKKFNYTFAYETKDIQHYIEAGNNLKYKIDKKILPHMVVDLYKNKD